jgi:hypothetical protein
MPTTREGEQIHPTSSLKWYTPLLHATNPCCPSLLTGFIHISRRRLCLDWLVEMAVVSPEKFRLDSGVHGGLRYTILQMADLHFSPHHRHPHTLEFRPIPFCVRSDSSTNKTLLPQPWTSAHFATHTTKLRDTAHSDELLQKCASCLFCLHFPLLCSTGRPSLILILKVALVSPSSLFFLFLHA